MPTVNWAVDADGDWSDAADWSPAGLPNSTDDVTINTTDLHTVTHSVGTDSVHSLTVGNDDFVMSGGSLTVLSSASFSNLLTVSGGMLSFANASATTASFDQSGGRMSGAGTLTVTGVASFTSTSSESGAGETLVEGSMGLAAGASLSLNGGRTLTLTGTGSTIAGSVNGTGTLDFDGGTQLLESGAHVGVSNWTIGGGAMVALGVTVGYAHAFTQNTSTIALGGHNLTLTGAAAFDGATVNGAGGLMTHGATSLTGLSLGGGAKWSNFGTVTETGSVGLTTGGGSIVNETTGVFDIINNAGAAINIFSGFTNDGLVETGGTGFTVFAAGAFTNKGTVEVSAGELIVGGAAGSSGAWEIAGGTLGFSSGKSNPNVAFTGTSGALQLSVSRGYTGTVSGFSTNGGNEFILQDISFVSANEATFSGNASGGILTVVGGKFTAHIHMVGDYLGATFTAMAMGRETVVVATEAPAARPIVASPHRFVAAAANLGGSAGEAIHASAIRSDHAPTLVRPHTMIA